MFLRSTRAFSRPNSEKFPAITLLPGNLALETGFAGLPPPPSSPTKPQISRPSQNRPFLWGFPPLSFCSFSLRGHFRSLGPISASLSLHPKIPFPAVGLRPPRPFGNSGILGVFRAKNGPFESGPYLSRVQSEGFELLAPFWRSIAKSLDADAAWQPTFHGGPHEIWREKRE